MPQIKQYIKLFPKREIVAGIDIFLLEGSLDINYTLLQKNDEKVSIIEKQEGIAHITGLQNKIPKHTPVQLSLNGKGIITRSIQYSQEQAIDSVIHNIIPGADIRLLYYIVSGAENTKESEISIVRKEIIDPILSELISIKLFVTHVYMGTSSLQPGKNLLDSTNIVGKFYTVHTGNNFKLEPIQSSSFSVHDIAGENLNGNTLLSFCNALNWYLKKPISLSNITRFTEEQTEEYLSFQKLKLSITIGLSAIFIILLVNFLSFGALTKKSNQMNSFLSKNKNNMEIAKSIKQEVSIKEKYLFDNNLLSGTKISYYCDRIGFLVPQGLKLTGLNIHPVQDKKPQTNKTSVFQNKLITILGSGDNKGLQEFINSLEKEDWVADVDLESFSTDKKNTSSFSLKIFMK
jgi:hypothetical protein